MDLQAAERAIQTLESEAQRVRGLGDLRAELQATQTTIAHAINGLENAARELSANSTTHAAVINVGMAAMKETVSEAAAFQQQSLHRFQERVDGIERTTAAAQKGIESVLRDGLNEVHAQTKATVREVDQTVSVQIGRALVEIQTASRAATQELSDRIERLQREMATSQELLGASIVAKLRLTILMAAGLLAAVFIGVSLWLRA